MPTFEEDVTVGARILLGGRAGGAVTFFPPDGFAWFHIDNGPAGGRPDGRLRISYGVNPGDNEVASLLQNGNVGIGISNPQARLHVNGDILVSGDVVLQNADCAEDFDVAVLARFMHRSALAFSDARLLSSLGCVRACRVSPLLVGGWGDRAGGWRDRVMAGLTAPVFI